MDSNQDQDNSQSIDVKVASVEPVEAPSKDATNESIESEMPTAEAANDTGTQAQPVRPVSSDQDTMLPPASYHPKSGAPVLVIIAAVLVAVGLAAVTIYAYIQSQDTNDTPAETTQTTNQAPALTGEDIDKTEADIDGALSSTEENDFPDSELTDQSLGL